MRNKIIAGLLALFFGSFGIHKFYVGEGGWGIFYLLFFWTLIPGMVAFFEAIGLFLMSEDDFNLRYNRSLSPSLQTMPQTVKERLDVAILRICREKNGATLSDCVIETGEAPDHVERTLQQLYQRGFLTVGNRSHDGAVIYTPC
ncbi:MAG: TM2 domain-containing protein [Oscillatoriales cyanobacterium SM2_2_1]|nr:TM2 domain-containing protein [Oscillatoriales cyanobacterium SM2_2_1]